MFGKLPAFPFYTGDWLKDPALTLCPPTARGIWIDLICAMHESDRSGKLCGTPEQLARVARCSITEFGRAITQLQESGAADVTITNGVVTVINRRMYREAKSRESDRKRQRRHRGADPDTDVSRSGHNASSSSPSGSSPSENSPLPPSGGKKRKMKTLIADDFQPSPETLAWCAEKRLPEPDYQLPLFVTYWQGRGEARADWQATFRNWMISPYRKDRPNGSHRQGAGGYESAAQRNARKLKANLGLDQPPGDHQAPGGELLSLLPPGTAGAGHA